MFQGPHGKSRSALRPQEHQGLLWRCVWLPRIHVLQPWPGASLCRVSVDANMRTWRFSHSDFNGLVQPCQREAQSGETLWWGQWWSRGKETKSGPQWDHYGEKGVLKVFFFFFSFCVVKCSLWLCVCRRSVFAVSKRPWRLTGPMRKPKAIWSVFLLTTSFCKVQVHTFSQNQRII